MSNQKIGFIGGGNMASSLIGGLLADGEPANRIWVSEPDGERLENLHKRYKINVCKDNIALVRAVDLVVISVKPQVMHKVTSEIKDVIRECKPLILSIAAGIRESSLSAWLGDEVSIVRTMPNTPALVQSAVTVLYANKQVTTTQRDNAESIMRAVGVTVWIEDEKMMDAVTALSGSGPAYLLLVMEMMEHAGQKLGLPQDVARLLTLQTAFGAAKMALESPEDVSTLRKYVTSPGGTTEQAVNVFEQNKIQQIFDDALRAAHDRSIELAEQLSAE